jgi:hypothetical protein
MDWNPGRHRRQNILVNVTRGGWRRRAFGRWGGQRVAVCNLDGGQWAVLGVDWNHLAHLGAAVSLLLLVKLVDEKLTTAARAVEHLKSTHHTGDCSSAGRKHHTPASSEMVTG